MPVGDRIPTPRKKLVGGTNNRLRKLRLSHDGRRSSLLSAFVKTHAQPRGEPGRRTVIRGGFPSVLSFPSSWQVPRRLVLRDGTEGHLAHVTKSSPQCRRGFRKQRNFRLCMRYQGAELLLKKYCFSFRHFRDCACSLEETARRRSSSKDEGAAPSPTPTECQQRYRDRWPMKGKAPAGTVKLQGGNRGKHCSLLVEALAVPVRAGRPL